MEGVKLCLQDACGAREWNAVQLNLTSANKIHFLSFRFTAIGVRVAEESPHSQGAIICQNQIPPNLAERPNQPSSSRSLGSFPGRLRFLH